MNRTSCAGANTATEAHIKVPFMRQRQPSLSVNASWRKKLPHQTLVICARNAPLKSALEQELSDWEIVVGPGQCRPATRFLTGICRKSRSTKTCGMR